MRVMQQAGDPLLFARARGGRVQIGQAALGAMLRFIQDGPRKTEAGGVLLGRHIRDSRDIVIDAVTTPLPGDRRRRTRFFRSQQPHQAEIDRAWRESGSTVTYLGEWHTHPQAVPTPSFTDQFDWRRKLLVDRFSGCLFFVVVGTVGLRVWEGRRGSPRLHELGHGA